LYRHPSHYILAKTRRNAKSAKVKIGYISPFFIAVFALFAFLRALRENPVYARINKENFHETYYREGRKKRLRVDPAIYAADHWR
jgi:hypothetical protein